MPERPHRSNDRCAGRPVPRVRSHERDLRSSTLRPLTANPPWLHSDDHACHPRVVRCPLLIGRDELLDLVDRRIEDVAAGHGQFLLLAGQAGIGKTRFLGAISRKAELRGFASRRRCGLAPGPRRSGGVHPRHGALDAPRPRVRHTRRTAARARPGGRVGRNISVAGASSPRRSSSSCRRLPGPTMLSFEDLHWTDDVSLESSPSLPAGRADEAAHAYRRLPDRGGPARDDLRAWRSRLIDPAPRRGTPPRAARRDGDRPGDHAPPRHRPARAARRCRRRPRTHRWDPAPHRGVARRPQRAGPDGRPRIREANVPDTIEDAIIARIARLSPEAQATARAGAVIGVASSPMSWPGSWTSRRTRSRRRSRSSSTVRPGRARPSRLYDFRHQLLRDALYGTIPASDRRRFHAVPGSSGRGWRERRRSTPPCTTSVRVFVARRSRRRSPGPRGRPAVRPARGLRVVSPRRRQHAGRSRSRGAGGDHGGLWRIMREISRNTRVSDPRWLMKPRRSTAPIGMPVQAILALGIEFAVWRREARPLTDRAAMAQAMWAELRIDGRHAGTCSRLAPRSPSTCPWWPSTP